MAAAPRFFKTPRAFRAWLETHHASATELLVGFCKVGSGEPSITWPESVDEALCFGWIDGVRKRIDDTAYTIRFTPRRAGSIWSAVNIAKMQALAEQGRLQPAGQRAFDARDAQKSRVYSYEVRPEALNEPYAARLAQHAQAKAFFEARSASYRRAATHWVHAAKQESTRLKRLQQLIEHCAGGRLLPQFTPTGRRP
jgi:uncharacterized protein YdeI (YjbR/CyaY-like superfamily)